MCSLAWKGLIGIHFQTFKKLSNRYRLKTSVETFKDKRFTNGVGIAALTSISAVGIGKNLQDFKDNDNGMLDLEEIVKKRALYWYMARQQVTMRSFFQKNDEPYMHLDWDGVTFSPGETNIIKINNGTEVVCTSSQSVVDNRSKLEQQHKLRAERQTSSVCESSLIQGFSIGSNIGLLLTAAEQVINQKVELNISTSFSLERREEKKNEEKDSWFVEDFVIVPRKSTIMVSRQLNEKENDYFFTTSIAVKGEVNVTYYQNNKIIGKCKIPMRTIIKEEFPKSMISVKKDDDDTMIIKVTGRFKFKKKSDEIIITPLSAKRTHIKKL